MSRVFRDYQRCQGDLMGRQPSGSRIREIGENLMSFHCPACGYGHAVGVNGRTIPGSDGRPNSWTWNGSYERPTFHPSLLINQAAEGGYPRCHLFVRDGCLQFQVDSTHKFAGQTVEMEIETDG